MRKQGFATVYLRDLPLKVVVRALAKLSLAALKIKRPAAGRKGDCTVHILTARKVAVFAGSGPGLSSALSIPEASH